MHLLTDGINAIVERLIPANVRIMVVAKEAEEEANLTERTLLPRRRVCKAPDGENSQVKTAEQEKQREMSVGVCSSRDSVERAYSDN